MGGKVRMLLYTGDGRIGDGGKCETVDTGDGGLVMRWQMIAHYVKKMSKRYPVTRFG